MPAERFPTRRARNKRGNALPALLGLLAVAGPAPAQDGLPMVEPELRAQVVARVNGKEVNWGEVARRFRQRAGGELAAMPDRRLLGYMETFGEEVLDDVINEILLADEAKGMGITVSAGEVDAALAKLDAALPEGETIDSFTERLGVEPAELRGDFEESLRIAKLIDKEAGGRREPSAEEVKLFYDSHQDIFVAPDRVRARHILIRAGASEGESALDEKRQRAEAVRKRLVGPGAEDFAAVAREISEDASAADGGDLGEFGPGDMVPEFEKAALGQEVGAVGPVVQTEFGFHIIKVDSRDLEAMRPLDSVAPMIVEHLKAEHERVMANNLIERLRRGAEIELVEQGGDDK